MNKSRSHKKGGIWEMVTIALPMVVSQACYTVMTFTDRMFLSRIDPELMNAAMGGGLTSFMMMTFFIGLTGYTTAIVAQYLGSGNRKNCAVTLSQALIIALAAYPLILSFRPLAHRLFDIMGLAPGQLGPQKLYFDILLSASVVSLLRNCMSAFFSGIGRTRIVMVSAIAAMVTNVGINYILIFGKFGLPALGIRGAAYGTIIGGCCGLAILAVSYLTGTNRKEFGIVRSLRFSWPVMRSLLRFGYPAGLEMFLNLLAFDIIILIFHSSGAVGATAATIVFNWDMVSFVPLLGIEIGVTSLVGRYMGAREPETAHSSTISGLKLGTVYSVIILLLFVGMPSALADIFRPDTSVNIFSAARPLAIFMIRLASVYVLVEAMIVVFIGALRGAGDTLWAMFISVSLHWILIPILLIAMKVLGASIETGWSLLVAIFFIFSFFVYFRYRSGHWRNIHVIPSPTEAIPVPMYEDFHESPDL